MRKHIKQNLLDIIKTMFEAHEVIKSNIESEDFENAVALLSDCQNTAVDLGSLIEKTEGENTRTVALLEEYCDELYNSAVSISENENVNSYKLCKNIDKKLRAVENSVRSDIPVRLEVVFMPYKASMWDSLESVWKAADEDPECDAYVVPIPYYDRTPQGMLGEYHYEGAEFPEYVPIVHYDAYNLEQRRPDVIYIHNPYDNNNFVTSVDPRFYSFVLKKYTDKLVYIPYFVLAEINPDDITAVKNIQHFCTASGVINADEVIVQSENMRQVYIKNLLDCFGDTSENRKIFEKKILGLGSPKFDKVANTKKEDVDVPEEWLKIIKKPNGENKKVIFYNTSLSALLQHNEKMIEKIRDVLRVFYENKDDVALLWRPHPLIKATIESMRPQLWEAYKEIVYKYVADGWGIYDDTSDLNRAIAISDAYYGDGSSVVQLCQKAGMPVMRQNVDVLHTLDIHDSNNISICTSDFCIYNEKIWFIHWHLGIMFEIDILSGEIERIVILPDKNKYYKKTFNSVCAADNKIFFIPAYINEIIVYDIIEHKFQSILIEDVKDTTNEIFAKGIIYNRKLYCLPGGYRYILSIDIDTLKKEKVFDTKKLLNKNVLFANDVDYNEETVIFALSNVNGIFKYNLSTGEQNLIMSNEEGNRSAYPLIVMHTNGYYIYPDNQYIYSYDNNSTLINKVKPPFNDPILNMVNNEFLVAESCLGCQYAIYNKDLKIITQGKKDINNNLLMLKSTATRGIWKDYKKDEYIYFSNTRCKIYHIHKNEIIKKIKLNMPQNIWNKYLGRFHEYDICESEHDLFSIIDLLKYLF